VLQLNFNRLSGKKVSDYIKKFLNLQETFLFGEEKENVYYTYYSHSSHTYWMHALYPEAC
jgi:hypothetical protein